MSAASPSTDRSTGQADPRPDQVCLDCKRPFVFGPKSDPRSTVYTTDGKKEVAISGVCERCFDFMFEEMEDDDEDAALAGGEQSQSKGEQA